ncbi:MAG: Gfo/Idh/MocA family oxidoreductase [Planctomycetaceae bacterium]|nr:Gfo/Idh/MocA family oxidoreductase [Planctomycetaceae bacterium]
MSRRRFLAAGALAAAPLFLPSRILGREGTIAPNDKIVMGMIGYGIRGGEILDGFLREDYRTVAVCDCKKWLQDQGVSRVNRVYNNSNCVGYSRYEDILERKDIDAVAISTPTHWHAKMSIEACKAGKDVFCEKPLTLTPAESRQIVAAARKYNRVCTSGSQRVMGDYGYMAPVIQSGAIGEVKEAFFECGGPSGDIYLPEQPIPEGLDWDRWLGPAPWSPYHEERCSPGGWRGCIDYCNGGLADWGAHKLGGIQYAIGIDHLEPIEILPPGCEGNPSNNLTFIFPGGIKVHHVRGDYDDVTIVGTEDTFRHGQQGFRFRHNQQDRHRVKPLHHVDVRRYNGNARDLHGDFAYSVRHRLRPFQDYFYGAVTATSCQLGCIAYRLNRALKWDADKTAFIGDEQANRWVSRPKRSPYEIDD